MKKLSIVLIGIILALSMAGLGFAQEKAKPGNPPEVAKTQAPKPEVAKPEEAKKETPKVVKYRMGGLVLALDPPARKITIKQHQVKRERIVTLMMSGKTAKDLPNLKVGDSVNVWVKGKRITALQKVS